MLNPGFSEKFNLESENNILLDEAVDLVVKANRDFATGPELRLQKVYGDELFLKLNSLGLGKDELSGKNILDLACGTGFLSYHLLKNTKPKSLTLIDISGKEIEEAKNLLIRFSDSIPLKFIISDITKTELPSDSFDFIIGNSFLHHLYNLPAALQEFRRILKPGGIFITLHEPTVASLAFESRNPKNLFLYFLKGDNYIDYFRYKGDGIAPGQGSDVWMFKEEKLKNLFISNGFRDVKLANWHCLRPKVAVVFGLHLGGKKTKLGAVGTFLLRAAILSDLVLRKLLPSRFFGSVALLAVKSE